MVMLYIRMTRRQTDLLPCFPLVRLLHGHSQAQPGHDSVPLEAGQKRGGERKRFALVRVRDPSCQLLLGIEQGPLSKLTSPEQASIAGLSAQVRFSTLAPPKHVQVTRPLARVHPPATLDTYSFDSLRKSPAALFHSHTLIPAPCSPGLQPAAVPTWVAEMYNVFSKHGVTLKGHCPLIWAQSYFTDCAPWVTSRGCGKDRPHNSLHLALASDPRRAHRESQLSPTLILTFAILAHQRLFYLERELGPHFTFWRQCRRSMTRIRGLVRMLTDQGQGRVVSDVRGTKGSGFGSSVITSDTDSVQQPFRVHKSRKAAQTHRVV
ncbi:hypothetical protein BX600DRAFT_498792 [Xylariales sp. PMI_506]|nr:hypothetical protein BX600DRAFT_498792 [Xylariales sp. PMI_506]